MDVHFIFLAYAAEAGCLLHWWSVMVWLLGQMVLNRRAFRLVSHPTPSPANSSHPTTVSSHLTATDSHTSSHSTESTNNQLSSKPTLKSFEAPKVANKKRASTAPEKKDAGKKSSLAYRQSHDGNFAP
ncbi:hypothetical protein ACHAQI_011209 [Fusarium lateritium]